MSEEIVFAKVVKDKPDQNIIKNNPELKEYLLCIAGKDGADDTWEMITGRTELYETIKNNIEWIDLERSFVLLSTAKLENRKSIVAFMKYCERFFNDSFDIEDYIKGDWSEADYAAQNNIDTMFSNNDRLNMEDFMNGEIGSTDL